MRALKRKRINYLRRKLILLQNIIAVVFSSLIRWFPCVGLVRTFYRWLKNNDSLLFSYLKNLDNRHGQIETNGAFTSLVDYINKQKTYYEKLRKMMIGLKATSFQPAVSSRDQNLNIRTSLIIHLFSQSYQAM